MSHRYVAIGCSSGGIPALRELLCGLPPEFPAPVVVAMHSRPESRLEEVLRLTLPNDAPMRLCEDGSWLEPGVIHVLPGARHGFFDHDRISLSGVVQDSGYRPSIDALFISLAMQHRENAIAVVLSGTMDDGMRGAQVIYDMGGRTIVQSPEDAEHGAMPRAVIAADHPHKVLPAREMGPALYELIAG